jgi:hypothetical protein
VEFLLDRLPGWLVWLAVLGAVALPGTIVSSIFFYVQNRIDKETEATLRRTNEIRKKSGRLK